MVPESVIYITKNTENQNHNKVWVAKLGFVTHKEKERKKEREGKGREGRGKEGNRGKEREGQVRPVYKQNIEITGHVVQENMLLTFARSSIQVPVDNKIRLTQRW